MKLVTKLLSGILSALLVAVPALADASQSSLWSERRAKMGQATQYASAAMVPSSLSALEQLPRPQSNPLSPSVNNEIARLKTPELKDRLGSIVGLLSTNIGTVRDVVNPRVPSGRIVVHVQDVHLNQEAQKNIGAAVKSLAGAAGVVALEGAFSPLHLEGFQQFPDRDTMKEVADLLLSENRISGPVHEAMVADKPLPAMVGVDDKRHYDANVEAYRQAALLRDGDKAKAHARERDLNERKLAVYSDALKRFDAGVRSYDKGQSSIGAYIRLLAKNSTALPASVETFLKAYEIEDHLDFNRVQLERSRMLSELVKHLSNDEVSRLVSISVDYRLGRMSHGAFYGALRDIATRTGVSLSAYPSVDAYIRYMVLSDGINADQLYRDIDALRAGAFRALATRPEEKALVQESETLALGLKLLDFALTPAEWEKYKEAPRGSLSFLGNLSDFEKFYVEAEARNDTLAASMIKAMDQAHTNVGVLVTGGFHSPGLNERFAKAGITTISFVPRLTKVDFDGSAYLSVFTQEKTPLDQLFAGPKLFLAQDPASPVALNEAAVLDAGEAIRKGTVAASPLDRWFTQVTSFVLESVTRIANGTRVSFRRTDGTRVLADVTRGPDGKLRLPTATAGVSARGVLSLVTSPLRLLGRFYVGTARFLEESFHVAGWLIVGAFDVLASVSTGRRVELKLRIDWSRTRFFGTRAQVQFTTDALAGRTVFGVTIAPVLWLLLGILLPVTVGFSAGDLNWLGIATYVLSPMAWMMTATHVGAFIQDARQKPGEVNKGDLYLAGLFFFRQLELWLYGRSTVRIDGSFVTSPFVPRIGTAARMPLSAGNSRTPMAAATEAARFHPDRNEDNHFHEELGGGIAIAGVMDGMGGHEAGDKASRTAQEVVSTLLRGRVRPGMTEQDMRDVLIEAMLEANRQIGRELPLTKAGTTATVMILIPQEDGSRRALIANAGDSRAYMQVDGRLQPLTVDNVEPDQDEGELVMDLDDVKYRIAANGQDRLAEVEGKSDMGDRTLIGFGMRKYVNNVLGDGVTYKPVVTAVTIPVGARLVLTSDGVHDNLTDREISQALTDGDVQEAAQRVVAAARTRSLDASHLRHKDDDITAVVIDVNALSGLPAAPRQVSIENGSPRLQAGDVVTGIEFDDQTTVTLDLASARDAVRIRRDAQGLVAVDPAGHQIRINPGSPVYVGRQDTNSIHVPVGNVSRYHVILSVDDEGRLTVRDVFSRNGTVVHIRGAMGKSRVIPAEADMARADVAEEGTMLSTFYSAESMSRMANEFSMLDLPSQPAKRAQRSQQVSMAEIQPRLDNLPLLEARNEADMDRLAFFKEFLRVLKEKHDSGQYSAAWMARARVLMRDFLNEADQLAGKEAFPFPAGVALPSDIDASSAFRKNADLGQTADTDTFWVALRDGNPLRIAVRKDRQTGALLTLGIELKQGDGRYRRVPVNGLNNERVFGVVDRTKLMLAGAEAVQLDYNADFSTLFITVRKAGAVRTYTVSIPKPAEARDVQALKLNLVPEDRAVKMSLRAAKEAAAKPVVQEPVKARSEVIRENLEFFGGDLWAGFLSRARMGAADSQGRYTVDALVDAQGVIQAVGLRSRFPAEANDRVAAGQLFVVSLRVQDRGNADQIIQVGNEDVPAAVRSAVEASVEAANARSAEANASILESRSQLIEPLKNAASDEGIVARNLQRLYGRNFWDVLGTESVGGNAGDAHAAVNGFVDPDGNIVIFGNIQEIPPAVRARYERREIFEFTIRVKMFPSDGPDYALYADNVPDRVRDILQAVVRQANDQARREKGLLSNTGVLPTMRGTIRYERYTYRTANLESVTPHDIPAIMQIAGVQFRIRQNNGGAPVLELVNAGRDRVQTRSDEQSPWTDLAAGVAIPIVGTLVIGRPGPDVDIAINEAIVEQGGRPWVSGRHVEISVDKSGRVIVKDASLNGTYFQEPGTAAQNPLRAALQLLRDLLARLFGGRTTNAPSLQAGESEAQYVGRYLAAQGAAGRAALAVYGELASQGHSGGSFMGTVGTFVRLVNRTNATEASLARLRTEGASARAQSDVAGLFVRLDAENLTSAERVAAASALKNAIAAYEDAVTQRTQEQLSRPAPAPLDLREGETETQYLQRYLEARGISAAVINGAIAVLQRLGQQGHSGASYGATLDLFVRVAGGYETTADSLDRLAQEGVGARMTSDVRELFAALDGQNLATHDRFSVVAGLTYGMDAYNEALTRRARVQATTMPLGQFAQMYLPLAPVFANRAETRRLAPIVMALLSTLADQNHSGRSLTALLGLFSEVAETATSAAGVDARLTELGAGDLAPAVRPLMDVLFGQGLDLAARITAANAVVQTMQAYQAMQNRLAAEARGTAAQNPLRAALQLLRDLLARVFQANGTNAAHSPNEFINAIRNAFFGEPAVSPIDLRAGETDAAYVERYLEQRGYNAPQFFEGQVGPAVMALYRRAGQLAQEDGSFVGAVQLFLTVARTTRDDAGVQAWFARNRPIRGASDDNALRLFATLESMNLGADARSATIDALANALNANTAAVERQRGTAAQNPLRAALQLLRDVLARIFRANATNAARSPLAEHGAAEATVGEALIAAALAVVRGKAVPGADMDALIGDAVQLNLGRLFAPNGALASLGATVNHDGLVEYLRANLDGRLKAGDLSLVEAQRIADKLSQWLGDTVALGNKEVVVVVRDGDNAKADLDNVEKLVAARRPGQPPVDVVVSADQQAEATRRFGNRAHIVVSQGPLITAASLDFNALQQAIQSDRTGLAERLSNTLLVVSKDVSVSSQSLPPNSPLRAMGYKSLEDVVENLLTPIQVLPLGTVIDVARVLAVQA